MTYERSAVLDLSLRRPRVARQGLGTSVRRFRLRRDLGPIDQRLQQEVAPLLHRTESGRLIPNAVSQAKREAIALAFELDNPVPQADEFNLGFLVGLFRREKLSRMRPAYRRDTDRYLTFLEGFLGADFVVSRVGPREWEAIADAILQGTVDPFGRPTTEPRQAGVSTVGAVVKTLRRLGRFAVNYRRPDGGFLLTVDPTRGLAIPKVSDPARPVATDDRTAALLEVAATVHPYLPSLIVIARDTGRRIGAIVRLRQSDWLPDAGTYGSIRWRAESDKLGRTTTVPVTPAVRDVMGNLGGGRAGLADSLFPAPKSDGYVKVPLWHKWLRRAEKLAGLPHIPMGGFHAFRRAWATKRKGLSLQDVAAAGGWRGTQVLQAIYQQADTDTLEEVVLSARPLRQVVGLGASESIEQRR